MQSRRSVPWREETFRRHDAGRHLNQKDRRPCGAAGLSMAVSPTAPDIYSQASSAVHDRERSPLSYYARRVQNRPIKQQQAGKIRGICSRRVLRPDLFLWWVRYWPVLTLVA